MLLQVIKVHTVQSVLLMYLKGDRHMVETAVNDDCNITCTCSSRDMFLKNF